MGGFRDNPSTGAFACAHVGREGEPAMRAFHTPTGEWHFACGGAQHVGRDMVATTVGALVERDPTLDEIADLPRGRRAERGAADKPWVVAPDGPAARGPGKIISLARAALGRIGERLGRDLPDARLPEVIARAGWMVMQVGGDASRAPFAYTIGLFHSFRHPELIMFCPRLEPAATMLNSCGDAVKGGKTLSEETLLDEVMRNYPVGFRVFDHSRYPDHLGHAIAFYRAPFPALQVCWPDRHGRFPWDPDCVPEVREVQPLS